jgi:hypothetical protein
MAALASQCRMIIIIIIMYSPRLRKPLDAKPRMQGRILEL